MPWVWTTQIRLCAQVPASTQDFKATALHGSADACSFEVYSAADFGVIWVTETECEQFGALHGQEGTPWPASGEVWAVPAKGCSSINFEPRTLNRPNQDRNLESHLGSSNRASPKALGPHPYTLRNIRVKPSKHPSTPIFKKTDGCYFADCKRHVLSPSRGSTAPRRDGSWGQLRQLEAFSEPRVSGFSEFRAWDASGFWGLEL